MAYTGTADELRTELAGRGLATSGTKDELVARLERNDAEVAKAEAAAPAAPGGLTSDVLKPSAHPAQGPTGSLAAFGLDDRDYVATEDLYLPDGSLAHASGAGVPADQIDKFGWHSKTRER